MFSAKTYLLAEWNNIFHVLQETLRYRYADTGFYEECLDRLTYFKMLIDDLDECAKTETDTLIAELDHLSNLIADIEFSHLEEFSWPFAYALKRISKTACGDLFFFRAKGGRKSYEVKAEGERPGVIGKRVNQVIFPRSLKESVLLHAILGHEVAHAIVGEHLHSAATIRDTLLAKSQMTSADGLYEWCRTNIGVSQSASEEYREQAALDWSGEFLCDLFGLVIMGPTFLPAFWALLGIISQAKKHEYVPSHPPFASRWLALVHAARELGYLYSRNEEEPATGRLTATLDAAIEQATKHEDEQRFAILHPDSVANAAQEIKAFVSKFEDLGFSSPDPKILAELITSLERTIPPAGRFPAVQTEESRLEPSSCDIIDFRHILLAGWLHWYDMTGGCQSHVANQQKDFQTINRLCSHAIMQQEGIVCWNRHERVDAFEPVQTP